MRFSNWPAAARTVDSFGVPEIIDGFTHQHNEASIKLLLKNGFVQQAVPRKAVADNRLFFSLFR